MPLQATSGAASYDAFGGGVAAVPNYIEECFSCFLYTGNGSTQTITNGIDLSTKGGLVWIKARNTVDSHRLFDTTRGVGNYLVTNGTFAQLNNASSVTAFNSTGFDLGSFTGTNDTFNYASWTFRKQPKFFDVVTYTGDGTSPRAISHNLGSAPGCVIIKQTNAVNDWCVWHTATGNDKSAALNLTDAFATFAQRIKSVTSTTFSVGNSSTVNDSGATYVAYLFAHDAGGFGLTGTDNVISCGSFTTDGSGAYSVTLGYEPQFVLMKRTDSTGDWLLMDNMRGMPVGGNDAILRPNTSGAETETFDCANPTATGFYESTGSLGASRTFIYIAIRRGPMAVPTSGTSVFSPNTATGNGTSNTLTTNFPVDLSVDQPRAGTGPAYWIDRLRGGARYIDSANTTAETTHGSALIGFQSNTTLIDANYGSTTDSYVDWAFRRAPSFFDEVCYTGTGVARTVAHNLAAVPELMIVKQRGGTTDWVAYVQPLGNTVLLAPNLNIAQLTFPNGWNNTSPTSTEFTVGISSVVNASAGTYVAYLFATCAGVSKVGSYTGNGSSQTINCGFTGGARFVMVKATSTTGNWIVADSARGIVAGNDPALYLNSTAAEVTGLDWIDADNSGFVVNETATIAANTNGVSYIFLAIA